MNIQITRDENDEFQVVPEILELIKKDINHAKNKFETVNKNEKYQFLKIDVYIRYIPKLFKVKYNLSYYPSNAFLKMLEFLNKFEINLTDKKIFMNAEMPGSFYLAAKFYNPNFTGYLSSYFPENNITGALTEDIYNVLKDNPRIWINDNNNNGDMTDINNILDYEERFKDNKVDGYTSDGALNTDSDPNNQELLNAKLHLGVALCGLLTIKKKTGWIYLKQFTFLNQETIDLIACYASLFEEFYISKPETSKSINSEIYMAGFKYKGITNAMRKKLIDKFEAMDSSLKLTKTVKSYFPSIYEANAKINDCQIKNINKTINNFNIWKRNPKIYLNNNRVQKYELANEWINKMNKQQ
jgi:FtsJ-like methyltransferase